MISFEQVKKNFKELKGTAIDIENDKMYDFCNDCICLYEDFEEDKVSDVIVNVIEDFGTIHYECYLATENSTIIVVDVDEATGLIEDVSFYER